MRPCSCQRIEMTTNPLERLLERPQKPHFSTLWSRTQNVVRCEATECNHKWKQMHAQWTGCWWLMWVALHTRCEATQQWKMTPVGRILPGDFTWMLNRTWACTTLFVWLFCRAQCTFNTSFLYLLQTVSERNFVSLCIWLEWILPTCTSERDCCATW